MRLKPGDCRLRFVPKRWRGPKDCLGYDRDGRFRVETPIFSWCQRHKWRRAMAWFSKDIDNLELQVFRGGKWKTVETWWAREQPYEFSSRDSVPFSVPSNDA